MKSKNQIQMMNWKHNNKKDFENEDLNINENNNIFYIKGKYENCNENI